MYCPRYQHFVRLNANGTFGLCGHMVNGPECTTVSEVKVHADRIASDEHPKECVRCWELEEQGQSSIRQAAIERDKILSKINKDYLIVGGTLDSYCNSACLTCSPNLSTKIAKLEGSVYVMDNYDLFRQLPQERIVELDINGGEPTFSKNYKHLLDNLPTSVKLIRLNTNGSRYFEKVEELLKRKIRVIVTLSLDGTGNVHDFIRWPIRWVDYTKTVEKYIELRTKYKNLSLDFWTTLNRLNLANFESIKAYAQECNIPHQYGLLKEPAVLDINNTNEEELERFVEQQMKLRGITWQQ
jgi:sulfatase maturation enzyme AslB (radical SAM superfamily)